MSTPESYWHKELYPTGGGHSNDTFLYYRSRNDRATMVFYIRGVLHDITKLTQLKFLRWFRRAYTERVFTSFAQSYYCWHLYQVYTLWFI